MTEKAKQKTYSRDDLAWRGIIIDSDCGESFGNSIKKEKEIYTSEELVSMGIIFDDDDDGESYGKKVISIDDKIVEEDSKISLNHKKDDL